MFIFWISLGDKEIVASGSIASRFDALRVIAPVCQCSSCLPVVNIIGNSLSGISSGDITFAVNRTDGDADDKAVNATGDTDNDGYESTSASVSYTVAPGVSAIVGFSDSTSTNEGTNTNANSGSSWYVGALVSF